MSYDAERNLSQGFKSVPRLSARLVFSASASLRRPRDHKKNESSGDENAPGHVNFAHLRRLISALILLTIL